MMTKHIPGWAALGCCAVLMAACGGGSGSGSGHDDEDPAALVVPEAALASPESFTQYAATLPEQDRREPLMLDGLLPPTSETAEPLPVVR